MLFRSRLARTAPDWEAVRAFTSPTIRRILAKRGEDVPSLPEALERLRSKGVRRAAVQPTHLLYGFEYDRLRAGEGFRFGPGPVIFKAVEQKRKPSPADLTP